MTNKLKMVLNLPCQEAFIGLLNTTVPICQIAGHLALDISKFPKSASSSQMWRQYHEMCLQPEHDPELLYFSAEGSSDQFDLRHRDSHEQGTTTSMAAELATDGSPIPTCRAVDGHHDGASSAAGPTTSKMDPTPRPVGHGTPRGPAEQSHQTMCSREDAPLWESKRKLRQVPDVREKVEVVRRRRSMDRPGILQAAATAIAFIFNSLELPGQSSTPSLGTDATSSTAPPPPGPPGPKALTGSKSSAETTSQGTATPLTTATRQPRGAKPKNSSKKRSTPTEEVEEVESSEYEWEQIG